ncbi:MAG: acyltransferase [Curvibacter sp.]|nr:acyltransferase [Curvibacter sp.]
MYTSIQFLRAVAALGVVLFHGFFLLQPFVPIDSWLVGFIHRGYVGVDVFFVISGFVATLSVEKYLKSGRSGLGFLINRALRIYLGYWPFYFLALVLAIATNSAARMDWDLVKSFFLWFLIGRDQGKILVLYVSWSLAYELIFYLFVASVMFHLGRKMMVIFAAVISLLLFCFSFFPGAKGDSAFVLISFFGEFLLGCLCYSLASTSHFSSVFKAILALFSISFGLYVGLSFDADIGPLRFFGFGSFSFGLVLFFVILEKGWGIVFNQFLVALGNASYTIYLCHTLIFEISQYFSANISLDYRWVVESSVWAMLVLLSIVSFSILYFRCVERPIYRGVTAFFRLQE